MIDSASAVMIAAGAVGAVVLVAFAVGYRLWPVNEVVDTVRRLPYNDLLGNKHSLEDTMEYNADQLANRERVYKARKPEADAYIRGMVKYSNEAGHDRDDAAITFEHQDRTVRNPFWSIKGEDKPVDPWNYYGRSFAGSSFVDMAIDYLAKTPAPAPTVTVGVKILT